MANTRRIAWIAAAVSAAIAAGAPSALARPDGDVPGEPERPVLIPATPEPAPAPPPTVKPVPPAPPPAPPAPTCPVQGAPAPSAGSGRRATVGAIPAPTTTPLRDPKPAPGSFAALSASFDAREGAAPAGPEARRAARRARYDAVLAYVGGHPVAPDLEPARAALFQLPYERQDWSEALLRAGEYLNYHATEKNDLAARTVKADALARLGRDAEARPAFDLLCRVATPAKHGKDAVFRVWSAYARWCLDRDDKDGAMAAWRGLRQAFAGSHDAALMAGTAESEIETIAKIGTPAPAWPLSARDLRGRPVGAEALKGKVVLIDFWASWCKPCIAELPNVLSAYEGWHARGLEVVGVSLDAQDSLDDLSRTVAELKIPWAQVVDASGTNPVAKAYGVKAIPYTVLVGADGRILRVGLRGADLPRVLTRLLGPPSR